MRRMADVGPVLVFDSGIGGLSVLRAIRERLPQQEVVYVADDAAFPYGNWEEDALVTHVVAVMDDLIARFAPVAVVVACYTASTLVLPPLRLRFSIPFVGTVPAIKPAAAQTGSGVIAVLSTPGTMKRVYTRELVNSFAQDCHVRLVGAPELARIAEIRMRGGAISREAVAGQIADCFVEVDGRCTDIVVLACTHYPFLADIMAELAPWPVSWLDPAPAIARRLVTVLEGRPAAGNGGGLAFFTSGQGPSQALARLLEAHGVPLLSSQKERATGLTYRGRNLK
jgi:glutamate racemase